MSDINLGSLINIKQQRDAVHFAIAPVCSDEILMPGQHVGLVKGSITKVESSKTPIGIVDPFLTKPVPAGAQFWLMLYQKSVTGMRHDWNHPAFPDLKVILTPVVEEVPVMGRFASEKWLRNFCDNNDCPGFDKVMEKAAEIADGGSGSNWDDDYMHFDGSDAHGSIPSEFWTHAENYLGRKIKGKVPTYFSCSC